MHTIPQMTLLGVSIFPVEVDWRENLHCEADEFCKWQFAHKVNERVFRNELTWDMSLVGRL